MLTYSAVSLLKGLKTNFLRQFQATASNVAMIASILKSDSDYETYGFLGELPQVREFLAERQVVGLQDASYIVRNRTWESTLGVKREDLEDDKLGALPVRIGEMAANAKQHAMTLLAETLAAGDSTNCYDGTPFFYDSHPARGQQTAVQDNLLTGSGTSVSNLSTDLALGKARLKRQLDEGGKPFRSSWGKIVVCAPPELEHSFQSILNPEATMISNSSNVQRGEYELLIMPELTNASDWYMLHVGGVLKPLILQERKPVEFTAMDSSTDEAFFMRGIAMYGTYGRYAGAYGMWQDAVKIDN